LLSAAPVSSGSISPTARARSCGEIIRSRGFVAWRKERVCAHADRLTAIQGDVTDSQTVEEVIAAGYEAIILAAAIAAGPEREASDPETILR
jgi:nucleoside-diphosphate-sugar epimerase